jgi:hypothetical protein
LRTCAHVDYLVKVGSSNEVFARAGRATANTFNNEALASAKRVGSGRRDGKVQRIVRS